MKQNKIKTIPQKILVCRTDKLGDFVLSLPSFILLKNALPDTKIIALTQEYTKPIAELCDAIDEIITISESATKLATIKNTIAAIKHHKITVSISLFTTTTLAIALFFTRIRSRIAPATKMDQLFYNIKLRQRRSQSLKPEFEYNLDLIRHYLKLNNIPFSDKFKRPVLVIDKNSIIETKNLFCSKFDIDNSNKLIFVHVGSGGSANNLSPNQYATLINQLSDKLPATFILCEGPEDTNNVDNTIQKLKSVHFVRYISDKGLFEFTKHIAIADYFISGSTGPLHIAGALDIPTIGFYPKRRSATATRWRTLNSSNKLLAFSPEIENSEDMSSIDIIDIANKIYNFIPVTD